MPNILIFAAIMLAVAILLWPRLAKAPLWRATITPLASIIGSGFLVLGPILLAGFGGFAPLAMLALCALAWGFGSAIRFNITDIAHRLARGPLIASLETLASASLAFAFFISVAYYLNLFGAFGVSLSSVDDIYHARLLTSAVFAIILIEGWTRGFSALERMEQVSVGLKLAIIAGLLAGLTVHFGQRGGTGALAFSPPALTGFDAFAVLVGLIVTVQGFETSRYLGVKYDAPTRVRSMRLAQVVSTLIYMAYIVLLAYSVEIGGVVLDETAIIELMEIVAPVLPPLLVAAALSAQFSAAVADTGGSGGLIEEVSGGRISARMGYALLGAVGLLLTWTSDVFEIISYASRAFAVYYTLQCAIAALAAGQVDRPARAALHGVLCLVGVAITLFGVPVE